MKEFSLTYTISGIYNDNNNIYDLEKYKFVDGIDLDKLEERVALWILSFNSDDVAMDMVHTDIKEDVTMEDDDEYSLGATG
tara:strand:+ start:315 stop:557 length:243 start_codon:yes stop_codon:yes gene_type:complete